MTKEITYKDATGDIPYNMTNDYMFRVVLQKNEFVLKGLICSLLHLNHDDVQSTQRKMAWFIVTNSH